MTYKFRIKHNAIVAIAFIAIAVMSFVAPKTPAAGADTEIVKFAQISDDHFNPKSNRVTWRMVKYSGELLKDAIDQINNTPGMDFVVFTGDLTDSPSYDHHVEFAKIANMLDVPWYWATGNHDLSQSGSMNRAKFLEAMNKHNGYIRPKSTCYSFTKGGVVFYSMDGASDTVNTAKGTFSKTCLGFLDKSLTENSAKPAVIFQHFPLVYPIKSASHEVTNQAEYLTILDNHPNVKAVISGHYHIDKVQTRNNVLHVSSPSLVEYPNAFRIITLTRTGGDLKIDVKTVETRLKNVQKMSLDTKGK